MEFRSAKDRAALKPKLDGMGNLVRPDDRKNPFGMLARNVAAFQATTRRRQVGDALGATPPRDGPFAAMARGVAIVNPPKSRQKRQGEVGLSLAVVPDAKIQQMQTAAQVNAVPITEPSAPKPEAFLGTANNQPHFIIPESLKGKDFQATVGGFSIVDPGPIGKNKTL